MDFYLRKILVVALLFLFVEAIRAETWNKITPLKSTRNDVEKILGKPNEKGYYELKEGRVRIFYGAGDTQANTCWGKVSQDIVTFISIQIEYSLNIKDLKLDLSRVKKIKNPHLSDTTNYVNDEIGIDYSVNDEDNEVYTIHYNPTRKDCSELIN